MQQVRTVGYACIQALQRLFKILRFVQNVQRFADGQGFIRRVRLFRGLLRRGCFGDSLVCRDGLVCRDDRVCRGNRVCRGSRDTRRSCRNRCRIQRAVKADGLGAHLPLNWRGTHRRGRILQAENRALHAIRAGQREQHSRHPAALLRLFRVIFAHRPVQHVVRAQIEQGRNRRFRHHRGIIRRCGNHLIKAMRGQFMHGVGIEDKLVRLPLVRAEILVCADFCSFGGQVRQVNQTIMPKVAHPALEGVLFVAVRDDAQAAFHRKLVHRLLTDVSVRGQQRANAEIRLLDIVLLQITEEKLIVDAHNCLHK